MKHILLLIALLLAPLAALCAAEAPKPKPNILVILADDLGYADLGCQGSADVKTPHIDSLAAYGVRCTAGYVTAPQCSPSRAGLLSGQYQQRFGHEGNPNFPLMLMRGRKIVPEYLKASGYATAHFGKWHLGFSDLGSAPQEIGDSQDQMLPTQHGFDESFGYPEYNKAAIKGSDRKERNGQSMGRPVDLAQDGAFLLGPLPRPREPARLSMTKVSETSAHASRISNPSTSSIPTQSPMRPRTSRRRLRRIREPTESRIR
jgi:hypothetical protein